MSASGDVDSCASRDCPVGFRGAMSELTYKPFVVLLGLGVALRVIVMALYWPAIMLSVDSPRYARVDGKPLFSDYWMPAGYPILLRLLRSITDQLWFTIAVQHLLGLSIGLLLYLALRRLGTERWIACIPAGVAFLSGDLVYLEHIIMADFLLGFLAAAGITAAVFALVPRVRLRCLALASVLLGAALLVRSVGIVLLPILAVCTLLYVAGTIRTRVTTVAVAILPGLVLFAIYAAACSAVDGKFWGLSDMSGWNVYSRVAPFADCGQFTPPPGSEMLCEDRPPASRPGPFGYVWDKNSIGRRHFKLGPNTSDQLGAFARQVILHQPLDYLRAVVIDLSRYLEPATGRHWPYAGQADATWAFGWRDPVVEEKVIAALARAYSGTELKVRSESVLNFYQHLVRLSGLPLVLLIVIACAGLWRATGAIRLGLLLFGLSAAGLYMLPVLTVSYDFRYGLPPMLLTVVAGVLGAVAIKSGRR